MKHSETLTLTEAIGALWDEDPELHEQLLIHRLKELLPEIIGPAYRWVLSSDVQDETLYLRTSSSTIAQDLRLRAPALLRSLNDRLGAELLRETRQRDRLIGYTTIGLHKDDLPMLLDRELIRKVGSEGQNKTFLVSLKFAQYSLLSETNPERPILLLDDIFDKLDAERVERIIRLVGGSDFGQIFITDTNRKYLDEIVRSWGEDFRLFAVHEGEITNLEA